MLDVFIDVENVNVDLLHVMLIATIFIPSFYFFNASTHWSIIKKCEKLYTIINWISWQYFIFITDIYINMSDSDSLFKSCTYFIVNKKKKKYDGI